MTQNETERLVPEKQYTHCPFCGLDELSIVPWMDDDGEYDAIECDHCKGSAPMSAWDTRIDNYKAEAFDRQLELLGQLLEQLEREGSPGISPESIFHKAIEEAVHQGQGLTQ